MPFFCRLSCKKTNNCSTSSLNQINPNYKQVVTGKESRSDDLILSKKTLSKQVVIFM